MPGEFLEQRIVGGVSYGSSYTDAYAVTITTTAGGAEYRKLVHPYPVRKFRLVFREALASMWADVVNLYHRCYGRYAGFRVKAFDDFTTAPDGRSAPTRTDQALTYVSSGVYQLVKTYGLDAAGIAIGRPSRVIYKPVSGTVLIAKNGALLVSGVTVDTTTGRVTISPAPAYPADTITGGCEFDIPVRFDVDLQVDQSAPAIRMLEGVELVELLQP
ncbi:MAG: DUF2460 domain-containing protein [Candidatus Accumulibacter propinquus]|jgi:uncharacterized protein (TIGR02217 family)|uniref:DUF2460 domain-containing protein n=1 Tax=Candidatus Accumulibacter propinquus TaxID=2954380 RepID=UPI002FC33EC9